MAKAGKGKKGKAVKVEGAEEVAYADLLEKRRRQEESDFQKKMAYEARKNLKEKMEIENKISKTNMLRIQNQWRKIMRLSKVEALRKEIEVLSQNHERNVDRKDAWIVLLDRDLEESEEQYMTSLRSHLQNVDDLINVQDTRLLELEREFERELNLLDVEFDSEFTLIRNQHSRECKNIQDVMSTVDNVEMERDSEAKQEHEQQREEIKNKNDEETHVLRVTLETNIDDLENHFESAHLNYLQNTDQRTQEFKKLTNIDKASSKESAVRTRKINRLESKIVRWRNKLHTHKKECEDRNSSLLKEKELINSHFQNLKKKMISFRSSQGLRLKTLTLQARDSKQILKERLANAERILCQAELARKLETEREKILPFYQSSIEEEEDEDEETRKREVNIVVGSGKEGEDVHKHQSYGVSPVSGYTVPEWKYLNIFIKKHNKVLLDKIAIIKEKERLEKENSDLQMVLKQYLDGISVNEDVLNNSNPLLIINGKVNLQKVGNDQPLKQITNINKIEGNHMILTRRVG